MELLPKTQNFQLCTFWIKRLAMATAASCYATAVIILDTLTQEEANAMPFTEA